LPAATGGGQPISLAVNLSPRLFERDHLCRELASVLADCGFPPQWLELEITESLLLGDTEHIIRQMQELKDWGASWRWMILVPVTLRWLIWCAFRWTSSR
jgi:EAL domain-containing protein (putative c-di-GMP-specific phosphodiesterase class I)